MLCFYCYYIALFLFTKLAFPSTAFPNTSYKVQNYQTGELNIATPQDKKKNKAVIHQQLAITSRVMQERFLKQSHNSKERHNIPHEDQSKIWPEGFRGGCSALAEFVSA